MSLTSRRTVMARKRYKPEEIVAKLRQVDVLVSQGQGMTEAIRQIGVSQVTCYRWRQEFGGLKIEQVERSRTVCADNLICRLRRNRINESIKRQLPLKSEIKGVIGSFLAICMLDVPSGRSSATRPSALITAKFLSFKRTDKNRLN